MGLNNLSQCNSEARAGGMVLVSYLIYFYLDVDMRCWTIIVFPVRHNLTLAVESGVKSETNKLTCVLYLYTASCLGRLLCGVLE